MQTVKSSTNRNPLLAVIVIDAHPGVELQSVQALILALMGKLGKAPTPMVVILSTRQGIMLLMPLRVSFR